jgi:glycosyltransferase involved in cell wall biosynthesis
MEKKINIAIITTHPIQYQSPLFRVIAKEKEFELTVFFASDHGINKNKTDFGFGKAFAWDVPLLGGYRHVFLTNSRAGMSVNDWQLDGPELKSFFKNEHFDAVLVLGWNMMIFWQAIWWGRNYGIPLILRGESNLKRAQPWYVKSAKKVFFPLLFKQFKAFLAIGNLNADLYKHYGVSCKAVFTAPYCVDNSFFIGQSMAQAINAQQLRTGMGIQNDATVFLFMGKFIDRKRPLDLIMAAAKTGISSSFHVIMVGDGPLMEVCRQAINTHGLNNVHLVGFRNQSELPTYYAAADVLVLPSEYETWGLVINEAMACGLPCVVSDACGAATDMIIKGKTGFTYPVGNIDSLRHCMENMVADRQARREMGRRAAIHVQNFSLEATVIALKDALRYSGVR